MPMFELEQYELHSVKYWVDAKNEAEAVARLLCGEIEPVENSLEYIEIAEGYGLPVDEHRELADELRKLGLLSNQSVIPSLRKIWEVI